MAIATASINPISMLSAINMLTPAPTSEHEQKDADQKPRLPFVCRDLCVQQHAHRRLELDLDVFPLRVFGLEHLGTPKTVNGSDDVARK